MAAAVARLSLVRPGEIPESAPQGRAARQLRSDWYQDHPGFALVAQRIVQIFRLAECGYPQQQCDLFDDLVETDAHTRNLFEQRGQAVAGKPWVVQAGGPTPDDELAARALEAALRPLPMVPVWEHQLTFNRYGWGASEIDWGVLDFEGRPWVAPIWFANVPARRFKIGEDDELRLLTDEFKTDGEPLAPGKWMICRRSGGRLARSSLMRTASWLVYFKKTTNGDWFVYGQRFGLPLVLVEYDEPNDETSKGVALEIAQHIGDDASAVVPKGIEVKVHDAARNGDASGTHGAFISHCNRELSKLINGSTLSNDNGDSGGASYALGDTHDAVRFENVLYDVERLQEAFRLGVAVPFVKFNGLKAAPPVLRLQVVRDLAPKPRADVAKTLHEMGVPLSLSQLRHDTGFREPLGPDDVLEGMTEPPPTAPPGAA